MELCADVFYLKLYLYKITVGKCSIPIYEYVNWKYQGAAIPPNKKSKNATIKKQMIPHRLI
jgi:hypothetical protein